MLNKTTKWRNAIMLIILMEQDADVHRALKLRATISFECVDKTDPKLSRDTVEDLATINLIKRNID